jgi:hypothetical protein
LILLRTTVAGLFVTQWSIKQLLSSSGADQMILLGRKEYLWGLGLFSLWVFTLWRSRDSFRVLKLVPGQLYLLTAIAVFLLPEGILLSSEKDSWLNFVATRMSLFSAVLGCVLLGTRTPNVGSRSCSLSFRRSGSGSSTSTRAN